MKYVSRVVEIDAEKIENCLSVGSDRYDIITDARRVTSVVSSQGVEIGDYLNVTDLEDIYHMPAKIIDGPNAKYSVPGDGVEEKSLNCTDQDTCRKNVSDVVIFGEDLFKLLSKASSVKQGWMKSTKAMFTGDGCVVQVTTQQKNLDGTYSVAEAVTYVPGVLIEEVFDKATDIVVSRSLISSAGRV